jgi:hypothetical protein
MNDEPTPHRPPIVYGPLDKIRFVTVFKSNATDVSRSTKAFNISRKTFYNWMDDTTLLDGENTFADLITEAREEMKDFGESQLLTLMKGIPKIDEATGRLIGWVARPDTACIIFYNKTKNKDRGYDERHILAPEGGSWPTGVSINVSTPEQAKQLEQFLKNGDSKPQ